MEIDEYIKAFKEGSISEAEFKTFLERSVATLPIQDAVIDLGRAARQGFPEVVYCEGKTDEQCVNILKSLGERFPIVMGTRARIEVFDKLKETALQFNYDPVSRIIYRKECDSKVNPGRTIAVVAAGTSDLPIAEEAALTAELMGNTVVRVYDVGVAGIHRLFRRIEEIRMANVVIAVAGMEGALASVLGGIIDKPLIAVPTSVGYGANFGGLAPLLSMLNSCAAGVGVVNIDNGFGAGRLAHMINSQR